VRTAVRLLLAISTFGLAIGTIYWLRTDEWVGSIVLWFVGLMPLIVTAWWVRRGPDTATRTADDTGAVPSDAAGRAVGSFPLTTAWPVFLVLGVIVSGASLVYGLILLPVGVVLLGWAIVGLARESRD
jgi:hypothetical protein